MRTPEALGPLAVDFFRSGPAFRRSEDQHWPLWPLGCAPGSRCRLDLTDLFDDGVERRRHQFVHRLGIVPFDDIRTIAVTTDQRVELGAADTSEHGGAGDLVAVQMKNRQDGAVS